MNVYPTSVDINGIDLAELLRQLYNGTTCRGVGTLHDLGRDMSYEEAEVQLANHKVENGVYTFDYVCGRPIKMIFKDGLALRTDLYDRSAGQNAFDRALANALIKTARAPEKLS